MQGCVGSDVIYTERRGQSQKPEEIYQLIEELVPGGDTCCWHMPAPAKNSASNRRNLVHRSFSSMGFAQCRDTSILHIACACLYAASSIRYHIDLRVFQLDHLHMFKFTMLHYFRSVTCQGFGRVDRHPFLL